MFGKKKEEMPNPIVIHYKDLWCECGEAKKSIHKAILTVIARKNVIDLYPDGADKDVAIKRLEEAKIRFRNTLSAYDDAKRQLKEWYAASWQTIASTLPSWQPNRWEESAEVVEEIYRHIYALWMREN